MYLSKKLFSFCVLFMIVFVYINYVMLIQYKMKNKYNVLEQKISLTPSIKFGQHIMDTHLFVLSLWLFFCPPFNAILQPFLFTGTRQGGSENQFCSE